MDTPKVTTAIQGAKAGAEAGEEAAAAAVGQQHGNDYAEDAPLGAAGSEPGAAPGEQAKKEAEASLRAAMPFWLQTADPAKLGPAIEAAKKAGVAAQTVATAEAKLTEAVSKAAKAAEEKERKEAEGAAKAKAAEAKLKEAEEKAKRAAAEKALKQTGTDAKKAKTAAAEDVDGDAPLAYKDEPLDADAKGAAAAVRRTAVAFFGNSILYYNDTPRLIESLSGGSVEQNSCLRGGVTFEQLLSKGNGMDVKFVSEDKGAPDVASLLSRSWHYVVMNDYTQAPAREESRRASVEVLKTQIAPLLEQCGGTPVLLETWAYRAHTKGSDDLGDHAEFTSRLQEGYREYAAALAEVLPEKQKPRVRCSPCAASHSLPPSYAVRWRDLTARVCCARSHLWAPRSRLCTPPALRCGMISSTRTASTLRRPAPISRPSSSTPLSSACSRLPP